MSDIVDHLHELGFRASREQIHALLAQLTASHASPQQALEGSPRSSVTNGMSAT